MKGLLVLVVACALLGGSTAWGDDSLNIKKPNPEDLIDLRKTKEPPPRPFSGPLIFDESSPKAAFQRIAKAWQEGRAESIAVFLGEGKVTITLPRVVGGVLSRDQAEYVLRDMFKFSFSETFEFKKYDEFFSQGTVGIAEWSYRSARGGPVTRDRIAVWLVKEGQDQPRWVIKEIKQA